MRSIKQYLIKYVGNVSQKVFIVEQGKLLFVRNFPKLLPFSLSSLKLLKESISLLKHFLQGIIHSVI